MLNLRTVVATYSIVIVLAVLMKPWTWWSPGGLYHSTQLQAAPWIEPLTDDLAGAAQVIGVSESSTQCSWPKGVDCGFGAWSFPGSVTKPTAHPTAHPYRAVSVGGRFVPAYHNGAQVGLKLHAIRPSGVLAALGLRDSDVVRSLNNVSLRSTAQLRKAAISLRCAEIVNVVYARRGVERAQTCELIR